MEKFTTFLMFVQRNNITLSEWVSDSELEKNMKRLIACDPEKSDQKWLIYLLEVLRDPSQPFVERELARKHIFSFYQATIFWGTRKFYLNFKSPGLWSWNELFDRGGSAFENLESAVKYLRGFDPKHPGNQEYVKRISYRKLTNWKDRNVGRKSMVYQLSWEETESLDSRDTSQSLSRQRKIQQMMTEQVELTTDRLLAKQEQEQVLSAIFQELKIVETDHKQDNSLKIGKTDVSLWTVLLLTYGLNLKQSATAELLTLNQQSINQATISRHLKYFVVKLQLKVLDKFADKIKDCWGDRLCDEESPIETQPFFQQWRQNKQKEMEICLKDVLDRKLFDLVVINKKSLSQIDSLSDLQILMRNKLDSWYQTHTNICIYSSILSDSLNQKIQKVVRNWAADIYDDYHR